MLWLIGGLCFLVGFLLGAASRSGTSHRTGGYSPLGEADTSVFPLGGSRVVPVQGYQPTGEPIDLAQVTPPQRPSPIAPAFPRDPRLRGYLEKAKQEED